MISDTEISDIDRSHSVAVLGSTPEFRDLLHEAGFSNISILERNVRFYGAMSAWRAFHNAESLVRGDWRDTLPLHKSEYSLILSDLTSGNIPYSDRASFYAKVTEALRPGGIFCDRVLTHTDTNLPLTSIFDKYGALPLNLLYVNHFSCEALFCSELLDAQHIVDSSAFYAHLQHSAPNEHIGAFVRHAPLVTPPSCIWYYGMPWRELQRTYCPDLALCCCFDDQPSSPYSGRAKLYFHQRKP